MKKIFKIKTDVDQCDLYGYPDICPYCHHSIIPEVLNGHEHDGNIDVLMYCPNGNCNRSFLAYYYIRGMVREATFGGDTSQGFINTKTFTKIIEDISPLFIKIHNQAYAAEQQGLLEICGVGYRKALEFLIKDYSIIKKPNDKEKIEKLFLGNVIKDYVSDDKVKSIAKRAIWIGNDETHYIRKWDNKNLKDFKTLIDITIHCWIEMERLTENFVNEMPE